MTLAFSSSISVLAGCCQDIFQEEGTRGGSNLQTSLGDGQQEGLTGMSHNI